MSTRKIVTSAFLAAVLLASKYALDGLPNVELISLLLILYVLEYPSLALPAACAYLVLYGLLNGLGIWWLSQLHAWALLLLLAFLFRKNSSALFWALISGLFGLCFGALCAIPYGMLNGGLAAGFAWWITGIPFDLLHGIGNFTLALLLFSPLRRCLQRTKQH